VVRLCREAADRERKEKGQKQSKRNGVEDEDKRSILLALSARRQKNDREV